MLPLTLPELLRALLEAAVLVLFMATLVVGLLLVLPAALEPRATQRAVVMMPSAGPAGDGGLLQREGVRFVASDRP